MTRDEHDRAILFDLKCQLEDLDLVDDEKREGARENIIVMVETLLARLRIAEERK